MDQSQLEIFRKRLAEMETELQEGLSEKGDATAPVQLDGSIGRLSRMDAIQSQQMALGLKVRQQQALIRVRNALEAIRAGIYGQCRRCRGSISVDRLEVQPDAILCVKCAESGGRK